ncbi:MAG: hypothetical protein V8S90_06855 [Lachnospiraceae bacterium]
MGILKKKKEENKEPQYYMSSTNIRTLNYKVYYMSIVEKIIYFLLAFAVGAACGYLFYGGIGKDEFGGPYPDNENTKYCNSINSRLCYRIFVSANQSKSDN